MDLQGICNEKSQDWTTDWMLEAREERDAEDFQVAVLEDVRSPEQSSRGQEQVSVIACRWSRMIDNDDQIYRRISSAPLEGACGRLAPSQPGFRKEEAAQCLRDGAGAQPPISDNQQTRTASSP